MTTATVTQPQPHFKAASFVDVLRSEWTKARTIPSTMWTLIVAVVLGVGLGALISAIASHHYPTASPSDRALWDPTSVSVAGLSLSQLAIGVLGILIVTSEYSTGAIASSLAAVPRRGRFLAAKALVVVGLTFVAVEITAFAAFLIGQQLIAGHAPTASLAQPHVLRALVGCGIYGAMVVLLGVALGVLLRSAAGAISVLVAMIYVLPGIAAALPSSIEQVVEKFWPNQAGQQITVVVQAPHALSAWSGLGLFAVFVAVTFTAAAFTLGRRDA